MNRLMSLLLLSCSTLLSPHAQAQSTRIDHMEPPFWWAGMQHPSLQLMVHGKDIAALTPAIDYPGVRIERVTRVPNTNYMFIDLALAADVQPGSFDIMFGKTVRHRYQLLAREPGSAARAGFSSKDAIYQVMPDRIRSCPTASPTAYLPMTVWRV
jgi:neopullulanase